MSITYDTYMVVHFKIHTDSTSHNKISTPISLRAYKNEPEYLYKELMSKTETVNMKCINSTEIAEAEKNAIKTFFNNKSHFYTLYDNLSDEIKTVFSTVYNDYIAAYKEYLQKINNLDTKETYITKEFTLKESREGSNIVVSTAKAVYDYLLKGAAIQSKNSHYFSVLIEKLYEYSQIVNDADRPILFIANLICAIKFIKWVISETTSRDNARANYKNYLNNDAIFNATLGHNGNPITFGVNDIKIAKDKIIDPYLNNSMAGGSRNTAVLQRRTHRNHRALRRTMKNAFDV